MTEQGKADDVREYDSKHIEEQIHNVTRTVIGSLALHILHEPAEKSRDKEYCKEHLYAPSIGMAPEELIPYDEAQPGIHDKMHNLVHVLEQHWQLHIVRRPEKAQVYYGREYEQGEGITLQIFQYHIKIMII